MTGPYPHYVVRNGRGYWVPTKKMKAMGFSCVACGPDGIEARRIALEQEREYQRQRRSKEASSRYRSGTIGWGFDQFRQSEEWKRKPAPTREEWERGWQYIEPTFADFPPKAVTFKAIDRWYHGLLQAKGVDTGWRAVKTWRSVWSVLAVLRLCDASKDPSKGIRRIQPTSRTERWTDDEVTRLIDRAEELGMLALACILSIAWDTVFSPGDVRTLKRKELFQIGDDWVIDRGRLKTGERILGALSDRSRRLLENYLRSLGRPLAGEEIIFRTRGSQPSPKGGRPRDPSPYTKNTLAKDFRILRTDVFGPDEKRKLLDLRRSGTIEAIVGDATAEQVGVTLGNSFGTSKKIQVTYTPNQLETVKKVAEARKRGRAALTSAKHQVRPLTFDWESEMGDDCPE
mgnify:FL=1